MARIVLDGRDINVTEDVEEVLARIVASRDGIRKGNGTITAPAGWMTLTESSSDEEIYIQVDRLTFLRED
jgi:hypothetical protein